MKVVILAGGKGTRLGSLTENLPKPMLLLAGKPILEYQIKLAHRYHLKEIIILSGYKGEVIEEYFRNGQGWGVEIMHYREDMPLGTAGSVKEIEGYLDSDFLVFYGDVLMDIDLDSLIQAHMNKHPLATLVVHPNSHPYDSDLVKIAKDMRIVTFHNKPHKKGEYFRNIASAALQILSPKILSYIPKGTYSDFARDIFPQALASSEYIYAFLTSEYIKDIGTVNRLKEVEKDIISRRVARLNKKKKQKAIFMDRDGVLNQEVNLVRSPEELILLPEVAKAVRTINNSDYLAIVITNQPAIAKGFMSEEDLEEIHAKLETLLGSEQAYVDRIYYCPHHPERGFAGERLAYKIECDCRKPKIGLIKKAADELNINLEESFIIGDTTTDIMTGINAGIKTVLVRTRHKGEDQKFPCEPDFAFENLIEAVDFITSKYNLLLIKAKS